MEQMNGREMVAGTSQEDSIIEASGVNFGNATTGNTFATKGHPNPIKSINSIVCNMDSVLHYMLVLFTVSTALMILDTKRMSATATAIN